MVHTVTCILYVRDMCSWLWVASQAGAVRRRETRACAPFTRQRSGRGMNFCQERVSNEGMYSRWATQKESDWLAQGHCLAPSLCRRDGRHHSGSRPAREKKGCGEKKLCVTDSFEFQPSHTLVLVERRPLPVSLINTITSVKTTLCQKSVWHTLHVFQVHFYIYLLLQVLCESRVAITI